MRGRFEQQIGPIHHPSRVARPVTIECLLHPFRIGRLAVSFDDAFQINLSRAGSIVRALPGDRIIEHNRICHRQNFAAGGKTSDRVTDGGHNSSDERPIIIRQFDFATTLRFPWHKTLENLLAVGKMLSWGLNLRPAIHGPAGNTFEHHDLAWPRGGQGRKDEVLANVWNEIKAHGGIGLPRTHTLYVT